MVLSESYCSWFSALCVCVCERELYLLKEILKYNISLEEWIIKRAQSYAVWEWEQAGQQAYAIYSTV